MFDKDPKQIIEFVLIFLPGFLCLALAKSIVDLEFTEFEFVYIGVALSIAIYLFSNIVGRMAASCFTARKRYYETPTEFRDRRTQATRWSTFILVLPVTALSAWLLGITVQNDLITGAMRYVTPTDILKKYRGRPQYVVFKSHHDCAMWQHDSRPADITDKHGKKIEYPPVHKNWIRIRGEKLGTYEGFPETFSISGKETEYYLSPACRVSFDKQTRKETVTAIPGPGVLILGKDILSIEFVDTRESACHFHYYQTRDTDPCPGY